MRLYIFSSIVFFLLAALLSTDSISIASTTDDNDVAIHLGESAAEQHDIEEALSALPDEVRGQVDMEEVLAASEDKEVVSGGFKVEDIQFNDKPWDRETNPVDIRWFPDWLNSRINDEIENSPKKAEQINENPISLIMGQLEPRRPRSG